MGNSLLQWRVTVGMFYNRCQGLIRTGKVSIKLIIDFHFLQFIFKVLQQLLSLLASVNKMVLIENFYFIIIHLLLILSGDVEVNPGPQIFKHSLSILHNNIRSLRNKMDYIKDNYLDFDILCFTETHLDDNILTNDIVLSETFDSPYRKDRNCHGGGILIYPNNNLVHERMAELENFWDECIWIKVKQKSQVLLLGVFYSPKTSDRHFFDRLNQNIEKAMDISKNIIIMGDLNEDLLNLNNHNLKNVLLVNSLNNIITEPTRGRALLDPVIIDFDQIVLDSGVLQVPPHISDHAATFCSIPFDYHLHHTYKRKIWLYKKANYVELENKVSSFDWQSLYVLPLNAAVEYFNSSFLNLVQECIPSKEITVRSDDKPWYDTEIRKFSRIRDRLKSNAIKTSRATDWRKYKDARNKVNNLKKYAKERFYNNLELSLAETFSTNKRDFWKLTRYFIKNNTSSATIPPLCTVANNNDILIHTTDIEKANCLNDYFTSISQVCDDNVQLPVFRKFTDNILDTFDIFENEVKDIIDLLDINKASGPDFINHKMLKYISKSISKPLTILFNRSLHEHFFPDPWKHSNVVPLFKKGERNNPSNYRPVSLCSSVGKIMERVVFKKIYNHLHSNNLIYKFQSGFLPGHSTTFQLIDIYHHVCQSFDSKQYSCMVFCDISKAFDRVWHKGLLFKLRQNGIEGDFLDWLSNYLCNRKQCVVLNASSSDTKSVLAGVPQGSVLGPLLFLIYVNDISEQLLSLIRLFADDSSLFVSASNIQDIEGILNHDLLIITAWAKQWLVNFNPSKTEAILFTLRQAHLLPNLIFDGINIDFVSNHKHLGITFNENGKWQTHIDNILLSASKVIGIMRKLKYSFSRSALNQIYISYVRPILEYSSIVWDNCTVEQANSLEKLQNEAARIVTGLTRSVSLERLYTECGWDSLTLRRKNQKLKFMYKVTNNMVPLYITDIIPQTVGNITDYNLRNRENLSTVPQRTTIFGQSCIPSSVAAWNSLDLQFRNCGSYASFCYKLKNEFCSTIKVPRYFLNGPRKFSVLHCRLRNNCSNLNNDLFHNHLKDNPLCDCLEEAEDAEHYIFKCQRYNTYRVALFHRTRTFHPLSIQLILNGNSNMSDDTNAMLFDAVFKYIKDTKRFTA